MATFTAEGRRVRGIPFSGPMVLALGRETNPKTETRRIAKLPDHPAVTGWDLDDLYRAYPMARTEDVKRQFSTTFPVGSFACPYGLPGDVLYVRESFYSDNRAKYNDPNMVNPSIIYAATPNECCSKLDGMNFCRYLDGEIPDIAASQRNLDGHKFQRLKPSRYMPLWAARHWLEVEEVRLERVQAITEAGAIAEGLSTLTKDQGRTWKWGIPDRDGLPGNDNYGWHWKEWCVNPRDAYATLWDQLNAKRGFGWALNPWVWVVRFRRIEKPALAGVA